MQSPVERTVVHLRKREGVNLKKTTENWLALARYDIDTAEAMLHAGRNVYVLFCCQRAIEKALKAIIDSKQDAEPPFIHNLVPLAKIAGIELSEHDRRLYDELTFYYIHSRYAERMQEISEKATIEIVERVYRDSKRSIEWLLSMLK